MSARSPAIGTDTSPVNPTHDASPPELTWVKLAGKLAGADPVSLRTQSDAEIEISAIGNEPALSNDCATAAEYSPGRNAPKLSSGTARAAPHVSGNS